MMPAMAMAGAVRTVAVPEAMTCTDMAMAVPHTMAIGVPRGCPGNDASNERCRAPFAGMVSLGRTGASNERQAGEQRECDFLHDVLL